jgi:glutamate-ammonia-ligase adenylyltransferase
LLQRWAEGPGLPGEPQAFLHLLYLAGTSEALTLSLQRRPHLLRPLSKEVSAPAVLGPKGMEEALGRFILQVRGDTPQARLAAFRMYQSARILLRETLGTMTLDQATGEVSALADALIRRAFQEVFQPLRERLGLPMRAGQDGRPAPCGLAVFALGKLGGGELNYASDVDLVFFYEEEGATDRGVENQRFFNAWVRDACALLTRPTPDGPALKVDPNLRPRGRDGELTLAFPAALAYYREWADLWERQAWTRARSCAGDLAAGGRFLRSLEDVLYKPYAFSGIAFQNRETRRKSLARLRSARGDGAVRDVKEGPGGIRDVEFAVQALQLAHGQVDRWVRGANTPLALARLAQKGHLTEAERATLGRAYGLLRKAEHWAQVQGMRQGHDLPEGEAGWQGLARYAGLAGPEAARGELAAARAEASRIFDLVCARLERASAEEDEAERLLEPRGLLNSLAAAGVPEAQRAAPLLSEIYRALEPHLTTPRRRNQFLRIHYSLQRELASRPGTHAGLMALHRLLPALQEEEGLLTLALDHPRLPRLVYWLAARSEVLLERMQQWPHLLKLLTFNDLRVLSGRVDALGAQETPDALRRAQKEALFLTGSRALLLAEGATWSHARFTEIAQRVLDRVFGNLCGELGPAFGLEGGVLESRVALLALGRFGTREMLPRSDLDLVIVKRGPWVLPESPERSAALEGTLVRRLADALTAVTRHGALYPVDLRLRPYGTGGPLLANSDSLAHYFAEIADAWERVAWLKARHAAGETALAESCVREVRQILFARGLSAADAGRLEELRDRLAASDDSLEGALKFGRGGLMTADLLLLGAQIRSRLDVGPCPRPKLLRIMGGEGVFGEGESTALAAALRFQESLLLRLRLKFLRSPDGRRAGEVLTAIGEEGALGLAGGSPGPAREAKVELSPLWDLHRDALETSWRAFRESLPST